MYQAKQSWLLDIFVTKTTNLIEAISWWLGCPPTQWWWGTGLPSYLVRQWRLATKHKTNSLWLRRGRTQSGPVLLQEKSIQTNNSLSLLPFVAISNTKVKIALPKLFWHLTQNIPCTPYHHPLSMLVFGQAFVRQLIWRRVISKYCFKSQLL